METKLHERIRDPKVEKIGEEMIDRTAIRKKNVAEELYDKQKIYEPQTVSQYRHNNLLGQSQQLQHTMRSQNYLNNLEVLKAPLREFKSPVMSTMRFDY